MYIIGDVDCTVHQELCKANGVRGYPTILAFKSDSEEPQEYGGARGFDVLKGYVEQNFDAVAEVAGEAAGEL